MWGDDFDYAMQDFFRRIDAEIERSNAWWAEHGQAWINYLLFLGSPLAGASATAGYFPVPPVALQTYQWLAGENPKADEASLQALADYWREEANATSELTASAIQQAQAVQITWWGDGAPQAFALHATQLTMAAHGLQQTQTSLADGVTEFATNVVLAKAAYRAQVILLAVEFAVALALLFVSFGASMMAATAKAGVTKIAIRAAMRKFIQRILNTQIDDALRDVPGVGTLAGTAIRAGAREVPAALGRAGRALGREFVPSGLGPRALAGRRAAPALQRQLIREARQQGADAATIAGLRNLDTRAALAQAVTNQLRGRTRAGAPASRAGHLDPDVAAQVHEVARRAVGSGQVNTGGVLARAVAGYGGRSALIYGTGGWLIQESIANVALAELGIEGYRSHPAGLATAVVGAGLGGAPLAFATTTAGMAAAGGVGGVLGYYGALGLEALLDPGVNLERLLRAGGADSVIDAFGQGAVGGVWERFVGQADLSALRATFGDQTYLARLPGPGTAVHMDLSRLGDLLPPAAGQPADPTSAATGAGPAATGRGPSGGPLAADSHRPVSRSAPPQAVIDNPREPTLPAEATQPSVPEATQTDQAATAAPAAEADPEAPADPASAPAADPAPPWQVGDHHPTPPHSPARPAAPPPRISWPDGDQPQSLAGEVLRQAEEGQRLADQLAENRGWRGRLRGDGAPESPIASWSKEQIATALAEVADQAGAPGNRDAAHWKPTGDGWLAQGRYDGVPFVLTVDHDGGVGSAYQGEFATTLTEPERPPAAGGDSGGAAGPPPPDRPVSLAQRASGAALQQLERLGMATVDPATGVFTVQLRSGSTVRLRMAVDPALPESRWYVGAADYQLTDAGWRQRGEVTVVLPGQVRANLTEAIRDAGRELARVLRHLDDHLPGPVGEASVRAHHGQLPGTAGASDGDRWRSLPSRARTGRYVPGAAPRPPVRDAGTVLAEVVAARQSGGAGTPADGDSPIAISGDPRTGPKLAHYADGTHAFTIETGPAVPSHTALVEPGEWQFHGQRWHQETPARIVVSSALSATPATARDEMAAMLEAGLRELRRTRPGAEVPHTGVNRQRLTGVQRLAESDPVTVPVPGAAAPAEPPSGPPVPTGSAVAVGYDDLTVYTRFAFTGDAEGAASAQVRLPELVEVDGRVWQASPAEIMIAGVPEELRSWDHPAIQAALARLRELLGGLGSLDPGALQLFQAPESNALAAAVEAVELGTEGSPRAYLLPDPLPPAADPSAAPLPDAASASASQRYLVRLPAGDFASHARELLGQLAAGGYAFTETVNSWSEHGTPGLLVRGYGLAGEPIELRLLTPEAVTARQAAGRQHEQAPLSPAEAGRWLAEHTPGPPPRDLDQVAVPAPATEPGTAAVPAPRAPDPGWPADEPGWPDERLHPPRFAGYLRPGDDPASVHARLSGEVPAGGLLVLAASPAEESLAAHRRAADEVLRLLDEGAGAGGPDRLAEPRGRARRAAERIRDASTAMTAALDRGQPAEVAQAYASWREAVSHREPMVADANRVREPAARPDGAAGTALVAPDLPGTDLAGPDLAGPDVLAVARQVARERGIRVLLHDATADGGAIRWRIPADGERYRSVLDLDELAQRAEANQVPVAEAVPAGVAGPLLLTSDPTTALAEQYRQLATHLELLVNELIDAGVPAWNGEVVRAAQVWVGEVRQDGLTRDLQARQQLAAQAEQVIAALAREEAILRSAGTSLRSSTEGLRPPPVLPRSEAELAAHAQALADRLGTTVVLQDADPAESRREFRPAPGSPASPGRPVAPAVPQQPVRVVVPIEGQPTTPQRTTVERMIAELLPQLVSTGHAGGPRRVEMLPDGAARLVYDDRAVVARVDVDPDPPAGDDLPAGEARVSPGRIVVSRRLVNGPTGRLVLAVVLHRALAALGGFGAGDPAAPRLAAGLPGPSQALVEAASRAGGAVAAPGGEVPAPLSLERLHRETPAETGPESLARQVSQHLGERAQPDGLVRLSADPVGVRLDDLDEAMAQVEQVLAGVRERSPQPGADAPHGGRAPAQVAAAAGRLAELRAASDRLREARQALHAVQAPAWRAGAALADIEAHELARQEAAEAVTAWQEASARAGEMRDLAREAERALPDPLRAELPVTVEDVTWPDPAGDPDATQAATSAAAVARELGVRVELVIAGPDGTQHIHRYDRTGMLVERVEDVPAPDTARPGHPAALGVATTEIRSPEDLTGLRQSILDLATARMDAIAAVLGPHVDAATLRALASHLMADVEATTGGETSRGAELVWEPGEDLPRALRLRVGAQVTVAHLAVAVVQETVRALAGPPPPHTAPASPADAQAAHLAARVLHRWLRDSLGPDAAPGDPGVAEWNSAGPAPRPGQPIPDAVRLLSGVPMEEVPLLAELTDHVNQQLGGDGVSAAELNNRLLAHFSQVTSPDGHVLTFGEGEQRQHVHIRLVLSDLARVGSEVHPHEQIHRRLGQGHAGQAHTEERVGRYVGALPINMVVLRGLPQATGWSGQTITGKQYVEGGLGVEDNRGPAAAAEVRVEAQVAAYDPVARTVGAPRTIAPAGPGRRTTWLIGIPVPQLTDPSGADLTTIDRFARGPRKLSERQLPHLTVLALTGQRRFEDEVLKGVEAAGFPVTDNVREQVRRYASALPDTIATAVRARDGHLLEISDQGHTFVVRHQARWDREHAVAVGAAAEGIHLEQVRVGHGRSVGAASGGIERGGGSEIGLGLPRGLFAWVFGLGYTFDSSWARGSAQGVVADRNSIRVIVDRYTGRTQAHLSGVTQTVQVYDPGGTKRYEGTVAGTLVTRMAEADAYRYGLPVSAEAVDEAGNLTRGTLRDAAAGHPFPRQLTRTVHTGQGEQRVISGVGVGTARDFQVDPPADRPSDPEGDPVAALRTQIIDALRGEDDFAQGFLPKEEFASDQPPARRRHRPHRPSSARDIQLMNQEMLERQLTQASLEGRYNQLSQDGIRLTLVRYEPRSADRLEQVEIVIRLEADRDAARYLGHTTDRHIVHLDIDTAAGGMTVAGSTGAAGNHRFGTTWQEGEPTEESGSAGGSVNIGGGRSTGVATSALAQQRANAVHLFEHHGRVAAWEVAHTLRVSTVDRSGRERSLVDGLTGRATLYLPQDFARTAPLPVTGRRTSPEVFAPNTALVTSVDATGLGDKARALLSQVAPPGSANADVLAAMTGPDMLAAAFKELISGGVHNDQFFRAWQLPHRKGGLKVSASLGETRFLGTANITTTGHFLFRMASYFTGHGETRGRAGGAAGASGSGDLLPDGGGTYTRTHGEHHERGRIFGLERIPLSFERDRRFYLESDTYFRVDSAAKQMLGRARFRADGVNGKVTWVLAESDAVDAYGKGLLDLPRPEMARSLDRWLAGYATLDRAVAARAAARLVAEQLHDGHASAQRHRHLLTGVLVRYQDEARFSPRGQPIDALLREVGRLAGLTPRDRSGWRLPEYLADGSGVGLGAIESLTLHRLEEKSARDAPQARPDAVLLDLLRQVAPGAVDWIADESEDSGADGATIGSRPGLRRVVEALSGGDRLRGVLDSMVDAGQEGYPLWEGTVPHARFRGLAERVEIVAKARLAYPAVIGEREGGTEAQRYDYAETNHSATYGGHAGFSVGTALPVGPDGLASSGTAYPGRGRSHTVTRNRQRTRIQNFTNWAGQDKVSHQIEIVFEVRRSGLSGQPARNRLRGALHAVSRRPASRAKTAVLVGELVTLQPRGLATAPGAAPVPRWRDHRRVAWLPDRHAVQVVQGAPLREAAHRLFRQAFGGERARSFAPYVAWVLSGDALPSDLPKYTDPAGWSPLDQVYRDTEPEGAASLDLRMRFTDLTELQELPEGFGAGAERRIQELVTAREGRTRMVRPMPTGTEQTVEAGSLEVGGMPRFREQSHDAVDASAGIRTEEGAKETGPMVLLRLRYTADLRVSRYHRDPVTGATEVADRESERDVRGDAYLLVHRRDLPEFRRRLAESESWAPEAAPGRTPPAHLHDPRRIRPLLAEPAATGHADLNDLPADLGPGRPHLAAAEAVRATMSEPDDLVRLRADPVRAQAEELRALLGQVRAELEQVVAQAEQELADATAELASAPAGGAGADRAGQWRQHAQRQWAQAKAVVDRVPPLAAAERDQREALSTAAAELAAAAGAERSDLLAAAREEYARAYERWQAMAAEVWQELADAYAAPVLERFGSLRTTTMDRLAHPTWRLSDPVESAVEISRGTAAELGRMVELTVREADGRRTRYLVSPDGAAYRDDADLGLSHALGSLVDAAGDAHGARERPVDLLGEAVRRRLDVEALVEPARRVGMPLELAVAQAATSQRARAVARAARAGVNVDAVLSDVDVRRQRAERRGQPAPDPVRQLVEATRRRQERWARDRSRLHRELRRAGVTEADLLRAMAAGVDLRAVFHRAQRPGASPASELRQALSGLPEQPLTSLAELAVLFGFEATPRDLAQFARYLAEAGLSPGSGTEPGPLPDREAALLRELASELALRHGLFRGGQRRLVLETDPTWLAAAVEFRPAGARAVDVLPGQATVDPLPDDAQRRFDRAVRLVEDRYYHNQPIGRAYRGEHPLPDEARDQIRAALRERGIGYAAWVATQLPGSRFDGALTAGDLAAQTRYVAESPHQAPMEEAMYGGDPGGWGRAMPALHQLLREALPALTRAGRAGDLLHAIVLGEFDPVPLLAEVAAGGDPATVVTGALARTTPLAGPPTLAEVAGAYGFDPTSGPDLARFVRLLTSAGVSSSPTPGELRLLYHVAGELALRYGLFDPGHRRHAVATHRAFLSAAVATRPAAMNPLDLVRTAPASSPPPSGAAAARWETAAEAIAALYHEGVPPGIGHHGEVDPEVLARVRQALARHGVPGAAWLASQLPGAEFAGSLAGQDLPAQVGDPNSPTPAQHRWLDDRELATGWVAPGADSLFDALYQALPPTGRDHLARIYQVGSPAELRAGLAEALARDLARSPADGGLWALVPELSGSAQRQATVDALRQGGAGGLASGPLAALLAYHYRMRIGLVGAAGQVSYHEPPAAGAGQIAAGTVTTGLLDLGHHHMPVHPDPEDHAEATPPHVRDHLAAVGQWRAAATRHQRYREAVSLLTRKREAGDTDLRDAYQLEPELRELPEAVAGWTTAGALREAQQKERVLGQRERRARQRAGMAAARRVLAEESGLAGDEVLVGRPGDGRQPGGLEAAGFDGQRLVVLEGVAAVGRRRPDGAWLRSGSPEYLQHQLATDSAWRRRLVQHPELLRQLREAAEQGWLVVEYRRVTTDQGGAIATRALDTGGLDLASLAASLPPDPGPDGGPGGGAGGTGPGNGPGPVPPPGEAARPRQEEPLSAAVRDYLAQHGERLARDIGATSIALADGGGRLPGAQAGVRLRVSGPDGTHQDVPVLADGGSPLLRDGLPRTDRRRRLVVGAWLYAALAARPAPPAPVQGPVNSSGAAPGSEPTETSIAHGTVRMEDHPGYPDVRSRIEALGYRIVSDVSTSPRVEIRHTTDPSGRLLRVERIVHVLSGMRFLDLEHEFGHVQQMEDRRRFPDGPPPTYLLREGADGRLKEVDDPRQTALQPWQDHIVEYHVRLEEFIRLAERGVARDVLREHAERLAQGRDQYWRRGLKDGRSPRKRRWAEQHFWDIPDLERRASRLSEVRQW